MICTICMLLSATAEVFLKLFLGGNPNEQPSFQGYNTQNFDELPQRSGNAGQWNYNHPAVNGPEMMNNHQGMGVAREEAVFNPRGPGRGGT